LENKRDIKERRRKRKKKIKKGHENIERMKSKQ